MSELEEKIYLFGVPDEWIPPFVLLSKESLERCINNSSKYVGNKKEIVDYYREALDGIKGSYDEIKKELQKNHANKLVKELFHKLHRAEYYLRKTFTPEELRVLLE